MRRGASTASSRTWPSSAPTSPFASPPPSTERFPSSVLPFPVSPPASVQSSEQTQATSFDSPPRIIPPSFIPVSVLTDLSSAEAEVDPFLVPGDLAVRTNFALGFRSRVSHELAAFVSTAEGMNFLPELLNIGLLSLVRHVLSHFWHPSSSHDDHCWSCFCLTMSD